MNELISGGPGWLPTLTVEAIGPPKYGYPSPGSLHYRYRKKDMYCQLVTLNLWPVTQFSINFAHFGSNHQQLLPSFWHSRTKKHQLFATFTHTPLCEGYRISLLIINEVRAHGLPMAHDVSALLITCWQVMLSTSTSSSLDSIQKTKSTVDVDVNIDGVDTTSTVNSWLTSIQHRPPLILPPIPPPPSQQALLCPPSTNTSKTKHVPTRYHRWLPYKLAQRHCTRPHGRARLQDVRFVAVRYVAELPLRSQICSDVARRDAPRRRCFRLGIRRTDIALDCRILAWSWRRTGFEGGAVKCVQEGRWRIRGCVFLMRIAMCCPNWCCCASGEERVDNSRWTPLGPLLEKVNILHCKTRMRAHGAGASYCQEFAIRLSDAWEECCYTVYIEWYIYTLCDEFFSRHRIFWISLDTKRLQLWTGWLLHNVLIAIVRRLVAGFWRSQS